MKDEFKRDREVTEAATPGPWKTDESRVCDGNCGGPAVIMHNGRLRDENDRLKHALSNERHVSDGLRKELESALGTVADLNTGCVAYEKAMDAFAAFLHAWRNVPACHSYQREVRDEAVAALEDASIERRFVAENAGKP